MTSPSELQTAVSKSSGDRVLMHVLYGLHTLAWFSAGTLAVVGVESPFTPLRDGDWSPVLLLALSALVCGFFWEMWNFHSSPRWAYAVPYVNRFHLFEMPAVGYFG
jgi:hypothetical protein